MNSLIPKRTISKLFKLFNASKIRIAHLLCFFYVFLSLVSIFQPVHSLNAAEVDQVSNQIIVKYKDPSFSPLASDSTKPTQGTASEKSPAYEYTAVFPGRIDVVLIEGENINQLLEELKNDPNVEYVEPNYIKQTYGISLERSDLPNDNDFHRQWALRSLSNDAGEDVDFLEAQALSRKHTPDDPVIIAIIDSTFSIQHPDLINQLWVNEEEIPNNGIDDDNNGYIDDIHGFNFDKMTADVLGDDNHGTHIAGICAAEKNNEEGISGAFPNVQFMALACSTEGRNLSLLAILQAEQYVIDLKNRGYNIVAVNASYGSNMYSQFAYDSMKNLSDNGIIVCAASGNDGWNLDLEKDYNKNNIIDEGEDLNGNGILEVSYPNSYDLPNIIGVGSLSFGTQLTTSSNYGNTEVDIAAPGVFIYSTISLDFFPEAQDITLSDGSTLANQWIKNSANISGNSLSGNIVYCGIGNEDDFPNEVSGNIALIQKDISVILTSKVANAQNAGAIATIIYNDFEESSDGLRNWELMKMPFGDLIPSFSISKADGNRLLQSLPLNATLRPYTLAIDPTSTKYDYQSGTSMACPFVTSAVAFAAHNFPDETMIQRRDRVLNNVDILPLLNNKVGNSGVVNLRKIVDTDEDKLPDWWEMDHFNTLNANDIQDNDNDGYTNREEFLSKTNPTLASDTPNLQNRLPIENLQMTENTLEFNFITYPGYQYTIQSIDSLGNTWQNQTTHSGDGTPMKATIDNYKPDGQNQFFYRLQVTE